MDLQGALERLRLELAQLGIGEGAPTSDPNDTEIHKKIRENVSVEEFRTTLEEHYDLINTPNGIGETPLILAVRLDLKDLVADLIDFCADPANGVDLDVNHRSNARQSALFYALDEANGEMLALLLTKCREQWAGSPSSSDQLSPFEMVLGEAGAFLGAEGMFGILLLMLDTNLQIPFAFSNRQTLIQKVIMAVFEIDCVTRLSHSNNEFPEPNVTRVMNIFNRTIDLAKQVIRILADRSKNIPGVAKFGLITRCSLPFSNSIVLCCSANQSELLEEILACINENHPAIASLLIRSSMNDGTKPIHVCAYTHLQIPVEPNEYVDPKQRPFIDCVRVLLNAGCDVNEPTLQTIGANGQLLEPVTALFFACVVDGYTENQLQLARFLVENGANLYTGKHSSFNNLLDVGSYLALEAAINITAGPNKWTPNRILDSTYSSDILSYTLANGFGVFMQGDILENRVVRTKRCLDILRLGGCVVTTSHLFEVLCFHRTQEGMEIFSHLLKGDVDISPPRKKKTDLIVFSVVTDEIRHFNGALHKGIGLENPSKVKPCNNDPVHRYASFPSVAEMYHAFSTPERHMGGSGLVCDVCGEDVTDKGLGVICCNDRFCCNNDTCEACMYFATAGEGITALEMAVRKSSVAFLNTLKFFLESEVGQALKKVNDTTPYSLLQNAKLENFNLLANISASDAFSLGLQQQEFMRIQSIM